MCRNVNLILCVFSVLLSIKHNSDASVDNIITLKPVLNDGLNLSDTNSYNRPCKFGVKPKRCVFKFKVSQTILDEDERLGLTINGQTPGPSINVCLNDVVVVEVTNNVPNQELSIHWHGMDQRGSPWMDGVPMITQCPITYATTYKYAFKANAVGSHFYHAFSAIQQSNGVYGALIVSQPTVLEPHSMHYDYDRSDEHTLIIGAKHKMLLSTTYDETANLKPIALYINGQEDYKIYMNPGYKYRLRMINAIPLECPIRVWIQDHNMDVIAADGKFVKMESAGDVILYPGERLDAIVTANGRVHGYWLVVRGLEACVNVTGSAMVVYEGFNFTSTNIDTAEDEVRNQAPIQGILLKSLNDVPANIKLEPSLRVKLTLDRSKVEPKDTDLRYLSDAMPVAPFFPAQLSITNDLVRLNNKNFMYPNSPLLTQAKDVKSRVFCQVGEEDQHPDAQCLQNIPTELNQLIEMTVVNGGTIKNESYTLHFHGNPVYVIAQGQKSQLSSDNIQRNLVDPPLKDTVPIETGNFIMLRMLADNPGDWLIECRSCSINSLPVAAVLRVHHALPKTVTSVLPKCGNYRPPDILLN